ncbi:coiled-coil domain-containing protein 115-like [Aphidius gifuensis]|uniref:coiled-coil domain-containing protein 115-like n=1 Tax=Aphidius gifuensis TaxID=684658 RepID=UPI001CDB5247|nr:coiled-coil domain-containing protein 115-like [Aphidius gifuensis]
MTNEMEQINEDLDKLLLRCLQLTEEKIVYTVQLENFMKDGLIEIAKSRYIQGRETVGISNVPNDKSSDSLFQLETSYDKKEPGSNPLPKFDIHLKNKEDIETCNPIKWFGVLVPQSLKTAQHKFQESIYLSVKIANITAELENNLHDFNITKEKIKTLNNTPEE